MDNHRKARAIFDLFNEQKCFVPPSIVISIDHSLQTRRRRSQIGWLPLKFNKFKAIFVAIFGVN